MLEEIEKVRQVEGEPKRRWFTDDQFDLIVFTGETDTPDGFHLCYGKPTCERILIYDQAKGFGHGGVDDGEERVGKMKSSPIMVTDGTFDKNNIAAEFKRASNGIDTKIVEFVLQKIQQYNVLG